MIKEEMDQKYIDQANALEAEFFSIIDEGKPSQHRILKDGKSLAKFNQRHSEIWHNHELELIAEGFMESPVKPEPLRDLEAEFDELKARVKELEGRLVIRV